MTVQRWPVRMAVGAYAATIGHVDVDLGTTTSGELFQALVGLLREVADHIETTWEAEELLKMVLDEDTVAQLKENDQ